MRAKYRRAEPDFLKKIPHKKEVLESFLASSMLSWEIVPVPTNEVAGEAAVRDINDRPIFRAAVLVEIKIFWKQKLLGRRCCLPPILLKDTDKPDTERMHDLPTASAYGPFSKLSG